MPGAAFYAAWKRAGPFVTNPPGLFPRVLGPPIGCPLGAKIPYAVILARAPCGAPEYSRVSVETFLGAPVPSAPFPRFPGVSPRRWLCLWAAATGVSTLVQPSQDRIRTRLRNRFLSGGGNTRSPFFFS